MKYDYQIYICDDKIHIITIHIFEFITEHSIIHNCNIHPVPENGTDCRL